MKWSETADVVAMACMLSGASLCLLAGIGLVRLPDVLTRMHAATKPQVLGLLLVLVGAGLRLRSVIDVGTLVLVGVFQLLTSRWRRTWSAGPPTVRGGPTASISSSTNSARGPRSSPAARTAEPRRRRTRGPYVPSRR